MTTVAAQSVTMASAEGAGAAGGAIGVYAAGTSNTATALSVDSNTFINNSVQLLIYWSVQLNLVGSC